MENWTTQDIMNIYRKRAKNYDLTSNLFHLLGHRYGSYRKQVVNALNLKKGDTVVDIGCGTGLNIQH